MMIVLGLLLSCVLSYLIASAYYGGWDKDLARTIDAKNSFKLIITPYQKRVLKLTILLSPFVFLLEALCYRLWIRNLIFQI